MTQAADPITFSVPRDLLTEIKQLSPELLNQMHALLERNAQGTLSADETAQLQTLVRMAQFSQIISVALDAPSRP